MIRNYKEGRAVEAFGLSCVECWIDTNKMNAIVITKPQKLNGLYSVSIRYWDNKISPPAFDTPLLQTARKYALKCVEGMKAGLIW